MIQILFRKVSGLNNASDYPIQSCKKMDKILERFREKAKNLKIGHLIPYNAGLNFFKKAIKLKLSILLSFQKIGQILSALLEKAKNLKNRHLITYNPGLKMSSKKQSSSNDAPYCPLKS